jgi:hypothetical protein
VGRQSPSASGAIHLAEIMRNSQWDELLGEMSTVCCFRRTILCSGNSSVSQPHYILTKEKLVDNKEEENKQSCVPVLE